MSKTNRVNKTDSVQPLQSGTIYVVDPSPLNWLFVLFNTMEEFVRANQDGLIVLSLAENFSWLNDMTIQFNLRKGVSFHNQQPFTAHDVKRNFDEMQKWEAPHPPGTWLNFPRETRIEVIDDYTINLYFSKSDGLVLGKTRAFHQGNQLFWDQLGFGYLFLGTGEGHW